MKTSLLLFLLTLGLISFGQNGNKTISETFDLISKDQTISYFEVTKEMYQMLSRSEEASQEIKDYISQLHGLKLIRSSGNGEGLQIHDEFLKNADLKSYTKLLSKREGKNYWSFYKKEGKAENEFLFLTNEMIIYITGTLDLKSIGELDQVMSIAGSAFDG